MTSFKIPEFFIEKVEQAGGYLMKSEPEDDAKGWVLVVELTRFDWKPPAPKASTEVKAFFPTHEMALLCADSFSLEEVSEGYVGMPSVIAKITDYFWCWFCRSRRENVGRLFRPGTLLLAAGENRVPTICDRCVRKFAAEVEAAGV